MVPKFCRWKGIEFIQEVALGVSRDSNSRLYNGSSLRILNHIRS